MMFSFRHITGDEIRMAWHCDWCPCVIVKIDIGLWARMSEAFPLLLLLALHNAVISPAMR